MGDNEIGRDTILKSLKNAKPNTAPEIGVDDRTIGTYIYNCYTVYIYKSLGILIILL